MAPPLPTPGLDYLYVLRMGIDELQWLQAEQHLMYAMLAHMGGGPRDALYIPRRPGGALDDDWKIAVDGATGQVSFPTFGQPPALAMVNHKPYMHRTVEELPIVPNDGTWRTLQVSFEETLLDPGTLDLTSGSTTVLGNDTDFTRLTGFTDGGYDRGSLIRIPAGPNLGTFEVDEVISATELRLRTAPGVTELGVEWGVAGQFATGTPTEPRIHRRVRAVVEVVTRAYEPPDGAFFLADVRRSAGVSFVIDRRAGMTLPRHAERDGSQITSLVPRTRRDIGARTWSFGGRALAGCVYASGGTYPSISASSSSMGPLAAGDTITAAVPVVLPDGAWMTLFTLDSTMADNDSEITATLFRSDGSTATNIVSLTRTSAGSGGAADFIDERVDNATYRYYIELTIENAAGAAADAKVRGLEITYQAVESEAAMVADDIEIVASDITLEFDVAYTSAGDVLVVYDDDDTSQLLAKTIPRLDERDASASPVVVSAAGGSHPSVVRLPSATGWTHRVVYSRSNVLYTRTSADDGATWSGETTLWDASSVDAGDLVGDPCLLLNNAGRLYTIAAYFDDSALGGSGLWEIRSIYSDDYGATWELGAGDGDLVLRDTNGVSSNSATDPDVVQSDDGAYHLVWQRGGVSVRYQRRFREGQAPWIDLNDYDTPTDYPGIGVNPEGANLDHFDPALWVNEHGAAVVVFQEYKELLTPFWNKLMQATVGLDRDGALKIMHVGELLITEDVNCGGAASSRARLLTVPGGVRMFYRGVSVTQSDGLYSLDLLASSIPGPTRMHR